MLYEDEDLCISLKNPEQIMRGSRQKTENEKWKREESEKDVKKRTGGWWAGVKKRATLTNGGWLGCSPKWRYTCRSLKKDDSMSVNWGALEEAEMLQGGQL